MMKQDLGPDMFISLTQQQMEQYKLKFGQKVNVTERPGVLFIATRLGLASMAHLQPHPESKS